MLFYDMRYFFERQYFAVAYVIVKNSLHPTHFGQGSGDVPIGCEGDDTGDCGADNFDNSPVVVAGDSSVN